jgi:hypothetical protein
MKKSTIILMGIFTGLIFLFSSCEKWIDTDINQNPDAPKQVPMNALLPAIELNMA